MNISFKNLSCSLGGREILSDVSGEIVSGKITAILGPNGCGKSTLLRALLGLISIQSGEILCDKKNVHSLLKISEQVGYLSQTKEVYWPLTCEAIMSLQEQRPENREITRMMERVNIAHLKHKRIDEISGGERALVLLARALVSQPPMIIADEPVSELDPHYQIQVMKILREEAARGAVVLTTMHDINLTKQFADQVFLIKNGKIFAQGDSAKILSAKNLEEVFGSIFIEQQGFYAQ